MEFNQWDSTHKTQFEIRTVIKKEEPDDPEWKDTLETKVNKKKSCFTAYKEILVLSELEESDEPGHICHTLKYQPRFIHMSNSMNLQVKDVPTSKDLNLKDTGGDERNIGKVCGAKVSLAELEPHKDDHTTSILYCPKEKKTEASQTHVCQLCGYEYASRQRLTTHMRIHTGETPYVCKICSKSFRRSDWLASHVSTHRDHSERSRGVKKPKKKHPCDHCEKTFRKKNDLRDHMRTHTGEKPYQCSICKMMFHHAGNYRRHLICHSDYRPYECSECGNSFKRLTTLNKHRRIHTGEKPFSCSCCGKTYRYQYSLAVHQKNHCQPSSL